MTTAQDDIPQTGTLVKVRGQRRVVGEEPFADREESALLRRHAHASTVAYPGIERQVHAPLNEFAAVQRRRLASRRGCASVDLVTPLLTKRPLSSPRAFAYTVGVYLESLQVRTGRFAPPRDEVPAWREGFFDDIVAYDDEEFAETEDDTTSRFGRIQAELADTMEQEIELLREMERWTARFESSLDGLEAARNPELRRVADRYREARRYSFPVTVIFVVPRRKAVQ